MTAFGVDPMRDEPVPGRGSPSGFQVVAVVIDEYACHDRIDGLLDEAERVMDLWRELGGDAQPGNVPPARRDQSGVNAVLADWAGATEPRSSVVMWLGHGEARGNEAWLATHETRRPMRGTGFVPKALADHIANEWRRRAHDETAWTLVVIEACGADTFVRLLAADLLQRDRTFEPERLAVIGVGGDGTNYLGDFGEALAGVLGSYTDNDREIRLSDLVGRLEDRIDPGRVARLGLHKAEALLHRRVFPEPVTAPMDVYRELRKFLHELPVDERGHFVPKAQGAEQGELAWYFVGRRRERQHVADWLARTSSGLLVVTGRAGSGKSALLGNVLVHANPKLRDLLRRTGFFDEVAGEPQPPPDVFDAVVHLTGLTTGDLVRRIARSVGIELAPGPASTDVDLLLDKLRGRPFTLLADALDEAQEPATVASSVLRRVAALPYGRVVVGTRASVKEGPDQPDTTAEDLLDALGRAANTDILVIGRDTEAIATYARRRLTAARTHKKVAATDATISRVAALIAGQDHEFLYARLAVHEILARPQLLARHRHDDLADLLRRDHRALFAGAVTRLAAAAPVNDALLEALALARGRGLPRADRIWATVATALAGRAQVSETDIDRLLDAAAPYIMLDAERGQSVYRLAHRTFQEYFVTRWRH